MPDDPQPLSELCGRCQHPLGEHYRRYDDRRGCSRMTSGGLSDRWELEMFCSCTGFQRRRVESYDPFAGEVDDAR
jgi:hypothetical protein